MSASVEGERVLWRERFPVHNTDPVELFMCLGADQELKSYSLYPAQYCARHPLWQISTLPELFAPGVGLPSEACLEPGVNPNSDIHIAVHYLLEVPPHERRDITIACAVAAGPEQGSAALDSAVPGDVVVAAVGQWRQFFNSLPHFSCSDAYLKKYYWYRWYGLRLCMTDAATGALQEPCVFEGIGGGFRKHISYSAQCHMLECAWLHDPRWAHGSLKGLLANQAEDGRIPGHVGVSGAWDDLYHADWGSGVLHCLAVAPDEGFTADVYEPLCRYARYMDRERDAEGSGLYDVIHQGETGQEYMPRYLAADPQADTWKRFRLKGVDATVYVYRLKQALAELARRLGRDEEAAQWEEQARAVGQAILQHMWDANEQMFFDCRVETLEPTGCKAAVGFYPFMTDLVGEEHLGALRRHLLNPDEFWLPHGPPSTSADDPLYSAQADWKGTRTNCPWNGRMWPMTSSHVCEALGRTARTLAPDLRPAAAELITRFIRTMFFNQDPERPNCFEHYNPVTGQEAAYRGIDDYQHSWVVDLIIRYVVGLQPQLDDTLIIDPLDFGLQRFGLRDVRYRGRRLDIVCRAADEAAPPVLTVTVDGEKVAEREGLGRIEVALPK